jgi:hypothetical protein
MSQPARPAICGLKKRPFPAFSCRFRRQQKAPLRKFCPFIRPCVGAPQSDRESGSLPRSTPKALQAKEFSPSSYVLFLPINLLGGQYPSKICSKQGANTAREGLRRLSNR